MHCTFVHVFSPHTTLELPNYTITSLMRTRWRGSDYMCFITQPLMQYFLPMKPKWGPSLPLIFAWMINTLESLVQRGEIHDSALFLHPKKSRQHPVSLPVIPSLSVSHRHIHTDTHTPSLPLSWPNGFLWRRNHRQVVDSQVFIKWWIFHFRQANWVWQDIKQTKKKWVERMFFGEPRSLWSS